MATRVFELAREIGVTSKTILDKCRAEGLELKNHMATLSAGLEATIREWFTEGENATAIETTTHVDLEQEREKAKKQRRRRHEEETALVEGALEAAETQEVTAQPQEAAPGEPQPVGEEAPAPAAEELAPIAETARAVQVAQVEAVQAQEAQIAEPQASVVAPEPVAQTPHAPLPPAAPVEAAAPAAPSAPVAARQPAAIPPAPAKEVPPGKAAVGPAGPQLIPRPAKLTGPRVVRMEKPDFVQGPPPRRRPPVAGPGPVGQAPPVGEGTGVRRPIKPVVIEEEEAGKKDAKKRSPRRRGGRTADSGAVVEGIKEWRNRDIEERTARLAAATGGSLRRHRAGISGGAAGAASTPNKSNTVEVEYPITVKNLSAATGIKSAMLIRKLMEQGVMATVNQTLEQTMAETVALDFGLHLDVKRPKTAEEEMAHKLDQRVSAERVSRAPVVTFLGHVDHGKTSLMDRIRKTTVASGEAGGITQHIGAYRHDMGDQHVVFLDTPGHEAFTAMRARGANMTDVVVLVVAADDGVMPQTVEAIAHAKAAGVPIIVALNKVDVPNANVQRALGQLAENGLQPREWGGNVEVIQTSAATGLGVDTLVETLSLEAEILELTAENDAPATGFVIESKMDPGLGSLARLLVRNGTLKVGDVLLAGGGYGRVRHMVDSHGRVISEAGPSTPVEVAGLDEIPEAGDKFYVVGTLDQAREVAQDRRMHARSASLAAVPERSLESLLGRIEAGKANELALIIKADVQGSIEAIVNSLNKLSTPEVRVNILHAAVGGITTGDVQLAEASSALIIGFNSIADSLARRLAEQVGVDIRHYGIIYNIIDDIRKALEEGLAPEIREQTIGHADVRQVFKVSRVGSIAGAYVTDGVANRNARVRITRNNIVIEDNRTLESLKRFKDDAREVRAGMECGLKIAGYDDIKEGDVLEFYQKIEVARTL